MLSLILQITLKIKKEKYNDNKTSQMRTLNQRENNRLLFVRSLNLLHTVIGDKTMYAKVEHLY